MFSSQHLARSSCEHSGKPTSQSPISTKHAALQILPNIFSMQASRENPFINQARFAALKYPLLSMPVEFHCQWVVALSFLSM